MNNSNNNIFAFLLLLVILTVRTIDYTHTPLYNPDKLEQLIAAQNWAEGNGVSRAVWVGDDALRKEFEPLLQWPPGYSLFTGLLLKLGFDIYLAALIPDLLSLLFLVLYTLLFLSGFTFQWKLSGFLIASILLINTAIAERLTSVDLIAYTCFFGALSFLIISVKKTYLINGILAGLLLGLSIWFRYAYIPQVLALLGFGILHQWRYNRATIRKVWIPGTVITLFSILLYALLVQTGNPGYIDKEARGLFWTNLLSFHWHFPVKGLLGMEGIARLLLGKSAVIHLIFQFILTLIICSIALIIILKRYRSRFPWPFVLSIIPINVGLLVYLSLTNAPQTWMPGGWTFVQEIRYYAPSWAAISMTLIWYLSYKKSGTLEQLVLIPIFLMVMTDAILYHKWRFKDIKSWNVLSNTQIPEYNDFKRIAEMVKNNNQTPVQVSTDPYTSLIAELAGWTPLRSSLPLGPEVCILQYELNESDITANQKIGLEIHLPSGRAIYLTNPPHLWN